jgi:hypothetical protein
MITCGAVPALLPAHIGVSQISQITASQDFADALTGPPTVTAHAAIRPRP